MKETIQINKIDNVAVALKQLENGIPIGHKIALKDLNKGDLIIKYGYPIGKCKTYIKKGDWLNENNIETNLKGTLEYKYNPTFKEEIISSKESRTFMGYKRENGNFGIRNEIWIVPTVGCVNGIAQRLVSDLKRNISIQNKPLGVDSIECFTHNYGCSQLGDDLLNTQKILKDIVLHPNAGAVLILALGCENNQPDEFEKLLGNYDKTRIKFLVCQKENDEIEKGKKILNNLYKIASKDKRTEIPISELRIGLKCGGSDGLSGITANPTVGLVSDYFVRNGASTILTEVPEMFGAETILMSRCKNKLVFDKTVNLINDFKKYFISYGEKVGENPSPGNKAGGISTLEDKSLGCIQKSGQSQISDVLDYGDILSKKGLNLLKAPGNDLVSSTALGAAGCHLILFTTGRGTPFGSFIPTLKISTNSNLFKNKSNWIDFDAGCIIQDKSMEETAEKLIDLIIDVANGKKVNSEKNGYNSIAIFKNGVTL